MYEKWANPKCPICRGVGSSQREDSQGRLMRVSCDCVNQARDLEFLAPLTPYLGPLTWNPKMPSQISPARHGLIYGDLTDAAPHIFRAASLWRRANQPWSRRLAVVPGDILLDHLYKKEYTEALLKDHHLVVPMATVFGTNRATDMLVALNTLMTSPPSFWPKFTVFCISPLNEAEMRKNISHLIWQTFCQLVKVYAFDPQSNTSGNLLKQSFEGFKKQKDNHPDPYESDGE